MSAAIKRNIASIANGASRIAQHKRQSEKMAAASLAKAA